MTDKKVPKEPTAPDSLSELQSAFADAITTPFAFTDDAQGWHIQTDHYPSPIVSQMVPHQNTSGAARLGIYNQQYWFRLLTVLQEEYPLLRHLLGLKAFNKMAMAYLHAHPSTSPSLRDISNHLSAWLITAPPPWSSTLHQECAHLERIHILAFDALARTPLDVSTLDPEDQARLLEAPLHFQPHWFLFEENWDLVALHKEVKHDDDDLIEVTPRPSRGFWAVYRTRQSVVAVDLGPLQFKLLAELARGVPLGPACETVAATLEEGDLHFLGQNIQGWFAAWAAAGWFVAPR